MVFRVGALDAGGDGGRAAVSRLHHVAVEVVIRKHRAAYRRDADGLALDTQFVDDLGDQAMHDAVGAAGAVMQRNIRQRVGFLKDDHA